MPTYSGGCHCAVVRFEVTGELTQFSECNCSICLKSGFLHWPIDTQQLKLITPWEKLSVYRWGTMLAKHHFCPVCGVPVVRNPRANPAQFTVNVRCIDEVDLARLTHTYFDGRNWSLDDPSSD
jgi:hypothetical protein